MLFTQKSLQYQLSPQSKYKATQSKAEGQTSEQNRTTNTNNEQRKENEKIAKRV